MAYIVVFLTAFFLTLFLSPLGLRISERFNIFSRPGKTGEKDKSRIGGAVIYLAFLIAIFSAYLLKPDINNNPKFIGLIISSCIIIILGMIDDIRELSPFEKIIGQFIGVLSAVLFGIITKIVFLPGLVNTIFTIIWVLFITNAFNMLDILDGLASGILIIISSTLLVISLVNRDFLSSIFLIALIGAHLGFLKYNYPPAKIYMGDTGSLFSGFLLALITINISYASLERPIALGTPLLVMSLPICDTFFLIIMRIKKRKPIFIKTGDHLVLRLIEIGYDEHMVVWIMYLFSIFLGVASLIVAFSSNLIGGLVVIIVSFVFMFIWNNLANVKVSDRIWLKPKI